MEYRTKEEQVADHLREGIISGSIPRGTRLKQQEIAVQLRVSITPVREALKLLVAEGYLSNDHYRGTTVVPFDLTASQEILRLRISLELQLVESAVQNLRSEDIHEISELAAQFEKAANEGDSISARGMNYRFHRRIFEVANLPQTLSFVQVLWARYPFDTINQVDGRALDAAKEHEVLLRNFVEGDVASAMLTMRSHIESGWKAFQQSLENGEQDGADTGGASTSAAPIETVEP